MDRSRERTGALRVMSLGALSLALAACDGSERYGHELRISELMADNEGAAVDELGEVDDWVELYNAGDRTLALGEYTLADEGSDPVPLPLVSLAPGERIVLWADDNPEQGALHLPFKLASDGESLSLALKGGEAIDTVAFPALSTNEAFARFDDADGAFARCRYATPRRANGPRCEPPQRPDLPDDISYAPYSWPEPWPGLAGPLTLSELALDPAQFIEVLNVSDQTVTLSDFELRLAAQAPGEPWPTANQGVALPWPAGAVLQPGQRISLAVDEQDVAAIAANGDFEGVASLFEKHGGLLRERVDFMSWPSGAVLARGNDSGVYRFCNESSEGEANTRCSPLASRPVGSRLRHLYTPGDFAALAEGGTTVGIDGVKFVVDLQAGGVVHFLGSRDYALHYTFVREQIQGKPPLNRCDAEQAQEFYNGWVEFSQQEYFRTVGRRYLLGTLNHHAGPDLNTVDFAEGDAISAQQMLQAFFAAAARTPEPRLWKLHPSNDEQASDLLEVNGQAPIVGQNAPYQGVTLQPLTPGVAYGQLRFVPATQLERQALGSDVILITDDVPNDIAFVGGLITEAFQTPLAHVNVLSRSRNTPNMALAGAREDPRITRYLDQLVRFEVSSVGFSIEPAELSEAEAFWESRQSTGARLAPRRDLSVRGPQALEDHGFASTPQIGAKAAQLAELQHMFREWLGPLAALPTPERAFALPIVHYVEHFERSGAAELYANSSDALRNPTQRPAALAAIRAAIRAEAIDAELLETLEQRIDNDFGDQRVRFRSSSNTEDLAEFNGAGLYTSTSAELGDPERSISDALHTVWASLWNDRAYDEREYANVAHGEAAMGVLVHPAYLSELANGVAISRDILDPIRADQYYVNVQFGEASVTNPAPGVTSEEFVVRWAWPGHPITYSSRSSLLEGQVLTQAEVDQLIRYLSRIHAHFQPLIDPQGENRWFAMDIEFKLESSTRRLIVKQARPYSFGRVVLPDDCREF